MSKVIEGVVAFSDVTEHEVFKGKSTGRYSMVIVIDPSDADTLSQSGVKVKNYEGKAQRKFSSKFHVPVLDAEGNPISGEVPYGSKVRLLWNDGPAHPEHGVPTYLEAVKVLERASGGVGDNPDF